MKKIGIVGLQREQVKEQIEIAAPGLFDCHILNDMDAAMKVKSGELDFYIGACNTGAGAAISMAIAIIGFNESCTIAKPSIRAKQAEVDQYVLSGKKAFGLSIEHIEHAIPMLVKALSEV